MNLNSTATSDKSQASSSNGFSGQTCTTLANTSAKTICDQENAYDCLDPHPLLGPCATSSSLPSYSGSKRHSLCSPSLTASVSNVTVIHQRSKSHQEPFPAKVYSSTGASTIETPHVSVWPADSRIRQQPHHVNEPISVAKQVRGPVVPVL